MSLWRDDHARGGEGAVHESQGVGVCQRVGQMGRQVERPAEVHRLPRQRGVEPLARHEFVHQVDRTLLLARLEQRGHVLMGERRVGLHEVERARALGRVGHSLRQHADRHGPAEDRVAGAVDGSQRAASDGAQDVVVSDPVTHETPATILEPGRRGFRRKNTRGRASQCALFARIGTCRPGRQSRRREPLSRAPRGESQLPAPVVWPDRQPTGRLVQLGGDLRPAARVDRQRDVGRVDDHRAVPADGRDRPCGRRGRGPGEPAAADDCHRRPARPGRPRAADRPPPRPGLARLRGDGRGRVDDRLLRARPHGGDPEPDHAREPADGQRALQRNMVGDAGDRSRGRGRCDGAIRSERGVPGERRVVPGIGGHHRADVVQCRSAGGEAAGGMGVAHRVRRSRRGHPLREVRQARRGPDARQGRMGRGRRRTARS